MLCKEIIEKIEETYSPNYAMEWDNVGLLAGRMEKDVKKLFIALDLTDEVLCEAVKWEADMVVTHHPLIFSPMRSVTDQNFIGSRIVKLIQNDISYYAMHTNYDILRMAELAAEMLGLNNTEVLQEVFPKEKAGIGKIGLLGEKMNLKACCDLVKRKFGVEAVKVFGDVEKEVKRVAICPGSGKSVIGEAICKKADVLITGDIDHHEGIDAVARNMAVIDAGHYGLEHIYMEDMKKFLSEKISEVEFRIAECKSPFQIL